jgi:hypothetical protein
METLRLDVPRECSTIALLYNRNVLNFNDTKSVQRYCEKMRLRIIGTSTQGTLFLIQAIKDDSSL